ncbi:CUB and sushi domain-containing protein 1, partial [Pteropus alecto]
EIEKESCGDPGTPLYGIREGDGFSNRDVLRFECQFGFELIGEKSIVCQENNQWSANIPICISECGGRFKGESSGRILSPGYPFPYDNNLRCMWMIEVDPGNIVSLQFLAFDTEASHDILRVWDGPPENEMLLKEISGSLIPEGIHSTLNIVTIQFDTDFYISKSGFAIQFSRESLPLSSGNQITIRFTSVGPITAKGFHFVYQAVPRTSSTQCSSVPEPRFGRRIGNEFAVGSLVLFECNPGYILHGSIAIRCDTVPNSLAQWNDSLPTCIVPCGGTLTKRKGTILSPGYPEPYDNNLNCVWKITVPEGAGIQVQVVSFATEHNWDSLDFYDGGDNNAPRLGSYSGTTIPHLLNSTSNNLYLNFQSDISVSAAGFHLEYTAQCGGAMSDFSGVILSPGFPGNYPSSLDCTWTIKLPIGFGVHLQFVNFSTETIHDYLEVRSGSSETSTVIGRLSGPQIPSSLFSTTHETSLYFHSDYSQNKQGFHIVYQAYQLQSCPDPRPFRNGFVIGSDFTVGQTVSFECFPGYTLIGNPALTCLHGLSRNWNHPLPRCEALCGGNITAMNGTIYSPGYPDEYPNFQDCLWLVRVPPGNGIYINFTVLQTEPIYDFITVWDGPDQNSPQIGQFSGNTALESVYSTSNQILIKFHSDFTTSGFFVLSYHAYQLRVCQPPPPVPNAEILTEDDEFEIGDIIRYQCLPGFTLVGNAILTCRLGERLQMDGAPPVCQGSVVQFHCKKGHLLQGSTTRTCLPDLMWSGIQPECIPHSCKQPETPAHANVVGMDLPSHGYTLIYTCQPGFFLAGGTEHRMCRSDNTWTGKVPVCEVPDDVFAQNYIWKGSYNFKGRKQPMTLTITSFNASTGRVNATLSNSNMELLLSGVYKSQEARLMLHIYLIKVPAHASAKKMKEENWAMDGFVSAEPDGATYVFQGFIQGKDYGQFGLQRLGLNMSEGLNSSNQPHGTNSSSVAIAILVPFFALIFAGFGFYLYKQRTAPKTQYTGCSVHENNNGQAAFENPMYDTNAKSVEGKAVRFDPNLNTVCTMV